MAIATTEASERTRFAESHLAASPFGIAARILARCLDLAGAIVALVMAAPLMAMAAMAIRVTSPGPVIFRQPRVGMRGRSFAVLKFRSMHHGADPEAHRQFVRSAVAGESREPGAALCKLVDDARVTRVGRLLRKLSIDELPQLFNVLKGDMRLVGPRPALAFEVEMYEPWQRRRLDVKPGMTGLWQVSGRSMLPYHEMLRLDVRYVDTWSLGQDVIILLRTAPALLRREAA
jgi:lipopolysaccharide/colanic/teichoic acid biosynthesis glycosyltransferase